MEQDFYKLLGVSRDADVTEIKKAYRNLARKYHPDKNHGDPEAEEMFKAVSVAYEVLSDPEKRSKYDQFGIDGLRQSAGGSGWGAGQGDGSFEFNLSDLFESFFGSGFSSTFTNQQQPSNDAQAELAIPLSEAAFGATKTIDLKMYRGCKNCAGSGAAPSTSPVTCATCSGSGIIQELRQTFFGQMTTQSVCPTCSGLGSTIPNPCNSCNGTGVTLEDVELELTIPAGVETGSRLRLPGQGPAGYRGTAPGDLYVLITVLADPKYERHGNDLVGTQDISFLSAIFGTTIEIETLDGVEVLQIPPGTQSGEMFQLKNRGMGKLRGRNRGHLFIYLNVIIPSAKDLTEEQKELLKQYGQMNGENITEAQEHHSLFEKVKHIFS